MVTGIHMLDLTVLWIVYPKVTTPRASQTNQIIIVTGHLYGEYRKIVYVL